MRSIIWQRAMLGVFLLLVGGFTLISLIKPQAEFSTMENRALQTHPDWEPEAILNGEFQEEYEAYLSDQFVLRDFWVDMKTFCSRMAGQRESNGVYFGKQEYLIEKYTAADYDQARVEENLQYLANYLNNAEKKYGNGHVACMFVPSKGAVLENRLPDWADAYDTSWVLERLKEKLDHQSLLLDSQKALEEHTEEYIYYRTDHHWTSLGAYYAYRMYCGWQGRQAPGPDAYTPVEVSSTFYGTTYDKVHMAVAPDRIRRYDPVAVDDRPEEVAFDDGGVWDSCYDESALKRKDQYSYFFGGNSAEIVVKGGRANGKTLLLVKDSFANCFAPFLLEQYEQVIMVDLRYVEETIGEILETQAPGEEVTDVLVLFNREKFMADQNLNWLETAEESDMVSTESGREFSGVEDDERDEGDAEEAEDWDENWDAEEAEDWDENWDAEEAEGWDENWDAEE